MRERSLCSILRSDTAAEACQRKLGVHIRPCCAITASHATVDSRRPYAISWQAVRVALTLKAAKDLDKVNSKALITFKSPKHGSFKSNARRTIDKEGCNQRRARLC